MRRSTAANAARPARPPRPNSSVWSDVQPAVSTLGDREDDGAEARRREHGSAEVEPAPARLLRIGGHDLDRGDRECRCDRQIDVEDHPPVAELGEEAADEDADRGARASDCSPGGERLRPLAALERRHDDRQRRRREQRGTETLARAGCEQGGRRARHRRRERRCGEDAEAGQEHPPTPEQIGGAAPEEEQASEDERVAGDRPADVGAVSWRSFARLGSAMFTAVMSRMTISWAISRTNRRTPRPLPAGDSEPWVDARGGDRGRGRGSVMLAAVLFRTDSDVWLGAFISGSF